MITLRNVQKKYNGLTVVDGVSLTIKPGEIVGLLGPNGAGKTTTIKMLAGVLPPSDGAVRIDKKNFIDHAADLKPRIGYLPENNPLYDDLTVEEHLQFWAAMKALEGEEKEEAIRFAVEKTGIGEVYFRLIGELSKGYRQRVGLAQAILSKPDILLLDEPTEGLDPNQRKDIQRLLSELGKERTVIVSSHVLGEISTLASRIVIIHKGTVVGDDSLDHLLASSSGSQVIRVEIQGKGVKAELNSLPKVKTVTVEDKNTYLVTAEDETDLRKPIYELAVKQSWTLLTLQKLDRKLEDVFSELTEE
jgi:ABC-2 type transport system ATP-binding protein